MTYFDTDVLVNAAVKQEPTKYLQANKIIEQTILSGKFQISWLSIQELGFVLAKLKEPKEVINESLGQLMAPVTSQLQQDNLHQSHRISPSNWFQ